MVEFEAHRSLVVIDDDDSYRRSLVRLGKALKYSVEVYESADAFLASDRNGRMGCIVLDVHMSGTTGLELLKLLKTEGSKTPVIMITAHEDDDIRAEAEELGAFRFFYKPFENKTLISGLEAAFADGSS